ncbi:MAG TPA: DUF302 domain-containing protein [Ktedonobacteraceae bacterium]|nr:DUF302 domain-containing protein [Ktedonobacteraceae bacterium]
MTNTSFNQSHRIQQTSGASTYGFGTTVDAPFEETITKVTEALKAEGFGVLTTIDVKATMKAKLDVDFERYSILGACNPHLAHRALEMEHNVGLLLPCNVVVHEAHEGDGTTRTRVDIADPIAMLGVIQNPAMQELASEARTRLERVVDALHTTK